MEAATEADPAVLYERARRVMPGGVTAAARLHPALGRPFYVARADGPFLYDLDGRRYYDLCNSHGATLLGHGCPAITRAVERALALGVACSAELAAQVELAERLCALIPCAEQVRFSNSGTETTWHALRAARAFTGREEVVKFEGHFHGYHDFLGYSAWPPLEQAGPRAAPNAVPESAGMAAGLAETCHVLPFNDLALLERTLRARRDRIAAVILEPINYNSFAIMPRPGYLEALRALTRELGIVLIFDEILSGFRTGPSGAQSYLGVTPDLCTLGKALGGGTVLSAFLGRRDIMATIAPDGPAVHSGTYNAHSIPIYAALAFLDEIAAPNFYPRLLSLSDRLREGIADAMRRHGVRGRVQGVGARFGLLFGIDEEATEYRLAAGRDRALERRFFAACITRGVYTLGLHHGLSAAYDAADVDAVLERIDGALTEVSRGAA